MASSDPVEVAVEILDQFSDDLKKLEKQLDRIDGKRLSVKLDIDDDGDIEKTKALLEALEENLKTVLDIEVSGEKEAAAIKKALAKNETATITYLTKGGDAPGGGGGGGGGGGDEGGGGSRRRGGRIEVTRAVNDLIDGQLKRLSLSGDPSWYDDFTIGREGHIFGGDGRPLDLTTPETEFMRRIQRGTNVATGTGPDVPHGPMPDRPGLTRSQLDKSMKWSRRRNMVGNLGRNVGRRARRFGWAAKREGKFFGGLAKDGLGKIPEMDMVGGIGQKLAAMRPTMYRWMNLIALIIPMVIALAGAALGAAAAIGGLAVAGAGLIGVGLLGYGDSLEESMKNLGIRAKQLKEDLYGVFQPVAQSFNPITERFLDHIPTALGPIADSMKGLTAFEDTIFRSLYGAANWVSELVDAIVELQEPIERVTLLVGGALGDAFIDLFRWSIKEVDDNWGAFSDLTTIFIDLIVVLYNVSKAASFIITVFRPVFDLFAWFSGFLNNEFILGLLRLIATYYLLRVAIVAAGRAWTWFIGLQFVSWAKALIAGVFASIKAIWAWVTAVNGAKLAWRAFLASTGLGLLLVGGSLLAEGAVRGISNVGSTGSAPSVGGGSPYGMGAGGGGGGTQINIYGNVGNSEYQKLADEFPSLYREEKIVDEETQK
ncbi:hypothetical protein [Halorubrum sp. F4]|uniref:hypothetical protein n=1 Tax=Halorubrum sp. F4 TaxID=2989715 RepID=UPI00248029A0|nr:hypothetical protein [Halorubrum sp. F4]